MAQPQTQRRPTLGPTLVLAFSLSLATLRGRAAESHLDYKYSWYGEEKDRIKVETHSVLGEAALTSRLSVKAEYVNDAISGATPVGPPPPKGQTQVPLVNLEDERNAGSIELAYRLGDHTLRPQVAYSKESDYESVSGSMNYSCEFNQKNTTLNLGLSYNSDMVLVTPNDNITEDQPKHEWGFLAGVNQLLSPTTLLTVNLTLGSADGYLNDPYKRVVFLTGDPDSPYSPSLIEQRPHHRTRQVGYVGVTEFFPKLEGSLDANYRISHDSYEVMASTVGLQWNQRLFRDIVLSPLFRFYHQEEAYFYDVAFPGLPSLGTAPQFYSSDFRLSQMDTFTYGVNLTWRCKDWFNLDFAYKRYDMVGRDGKTSPSAYPKANVFSGGIRIWF